MKILIVADDECPSLWEYYTPGKLSAYDLILSCGDLKPKYLSFLVTMAKCPLFYIHGNHDSNYVQTPPEGCDCADDKLVIYRGVRILGLGGSREYGGSAYQYTERQMEKRIRRLRRAIRAAGGVDIVIAHTAPRGVGDCDNQTHRGFDAFLSLIDTYHPKYFFHGHIHLNYGGSIPRTQEYHGTQVVNCFRKNEIDYDFPAHPAPMRFLKRLYCRLFVKELEIVP